MKVRLDWQKKAVVIFAVAISSLSILLTIFAIRAADRERLVLERGMQEEQRGLAELIVSQIKATVSELEGRVGRLIGSYQIQSQTDLAEICKRIVEGEEIVAEIFTIDENKKGTFPLTKSFYASVNPDRGMDRESTNIKSDSQWSKAEIAEFEEQDYLVAIELYRELMKADSVYRGALANCIGRCYRKAGRYPEAIGTYQDALADHADEISFDGTPLAVIAHYQIGDIRLSTGRKLDGVESLLELYDGLLKSQWLLSKGQFHFYLERVRDMLNGAMIDSDEIGNNRALAEKWNSLKKLEEEKTIRMNAINNITQKIIPMIAAQLPIRDAVPGKFYRISDTIEGEAYLISYAPIDSKILGIMMDEETIARDLLPPKLSMLPLRSGWYVQVTDENGNRLAGENMNHLEGNTPQLTLSADLGSDFFPWKVNIYQTDTSASSSLSILRRNIYILSVVVIMTVIIFGGYWAIRSTSKELKLASLKSEFVSTVSHELRTPLMSIRYLAELLERGRVNDESRKQQYYETITNESERLGRLIDNILNFSRMEAGMKEYQFEDTDIAELSRDVASRFQEQISQDGFAIDTHISDSIPEVLVDGEAISQTLFNLLDNAHKYSGESRSIYLSAWSDDDSIFLEVQDEGIGIRREEQKRIFEKFYRSEDLLDKTIWGSGIGLTLVAHIVEAHDGEVILESKHGKGTKVTIKLPIKRSKLESQANRKLEDEEADRDV